MEQRHLGRTGLRVSRLGLGTMTWGRDTDEHDAAEQLQAFRDAGGTLVDTADVYGGRRRRVRCSGGSCRTWSRGTSSSSPRRRAASPARTGRFDGSRGHLLAALDASLQRLGTDYVDLWQVHALTRAPRWRRRSRARPRGAQRPGALRRGLQLLRLAARRRPRPGSGPGPGGPRSPRPRWSTPCCSAASSGRCCRPRLDLGVGLLPSSPLGRGVLTGKYRHGIPADSRAASPHLAPSSSRYLDDAAPGSWTRGDRRRRPRASPLEVALAWVRDRPGVSAPIVGARTAASCGLAPRRGTVLPDEIRDALDEVSAPPSATRAVLD